MYKGTRSKRTKKTIKRNRPNKSTRRNKSKKGIRRTRRRKNARRSLEKTPIMRFNRNLMMRGGNVAGAGASAYPKGYTQPINNNANGLANMGAPYNVGESLPGGNYLPINLNVVDPPVQSNSQFGGGKRKKGRKRQTGGGISSFISSILPDEMVNIGRAFPAGIGHMIDTFNGEISPHSSHVFPTQQPHVTDINQTTTISPVNLKQIYDSANATVRAI